MSSTASVHCGSATCCAASVARRSCGSPRTISSARGTSFASVKASTVQAASRMPRTLTAVTSATTSVMTPTRPTPVPAQGTSAARYATNTLRIAAPESSRVQMCSQPTAKPTCRPNAA